MEVLKQHELTINISARSRTNITTHTTFFSMDVKTTKKIINFTLDGAPLDLTSATVLLGFEFVDAGTSKIIDSKDGAVVIENSEEGRCSVKLPNHLYEYSGRVYVHTYIMFDDGRSLDAGIIVTQFEESWLDSELEEMADFYVKRFEDLAEEIRQRASRLQDELDGLQTQADDLQAQINNNDMVTRLEFDAHTHHASAINAGTLALARIPTGTGASQVAIGNHVHANATTSANGLMSSADKARLDGIVPSTTHPLANSEVSSAGTGNAYARANHVHPMQTTVSGNAGTATLLATARTINGTSFNGGSNITTANWGTARNLTIGNLTRSVNGSANVAWSLADIGAASVAHTHHASAINAGTFDLARIPNINFDRLRGAARHLPANTNLNTIFEGGFYRVNNATNLPSGAGSWIYLSVIQQGAQECCQIIYPFNNPTAMWIRRSDSTGSWGEWSRPVSDWNTLVNRPSTFAPSAHTHSASAINAGTFDLARIPNLPASRINSGTFDLARIPNLPVSMLNGVCRGVTGNWNDHQASGFYMGQNLLNTPPATNGSHSWWYVLVMQHNHSHSLQIATDFRNRATYRRVFFNGMWQDWVLGLDAHHLPQASSHSANGVGAYRIGNLLIQTGRVVLTLSSGNQSTSTISFPIGYRLHPNVQLTSTTPVHQTSLFSVSATTNTNFTVSFDPGGASNIRNFQWVAIGVVN